MNKAAKRKIIYAACELIETGKLIPSCAALATARSLLFKSIRPPIVIDYCSFYEKDYGTYWLRNERDVRAWEDIKSLRILLLLNFLEATT